MSAYLLEMFGVSLGLTLLLELGISRLMGLRGRDVFLLVVLVNVLTNPAAVLLNWLGLPQLPIELAVFLIEAWIYCRFAKDERWIIPHPVLLSALANGISWGFGMMIGGLL